MKKMFIAVVLCISLIMVGGNALAQSAVANVENVTSGASVQDVNAGASIDDHSTNTSNVYDRKFVNPGVVPFPQTNGFFTSPTPDSSFRSIKDLLDVFGDGTTLRMTEGALRSLAKGGKVDTNFQVINDENRVKRAYDKDFTGDRWLWITIQKPVNGFEATALVDAEADHSDTNSFHVLGRMGLKALRDGNNVLVITSEGAHRMVQAKGWGIGLYVAGGVTNTSGKESISPGGGTGYAQNTSGTEDMPWLHGHVGNDVSLLASLPIPVVTEEMVAYVQTGNHTKHGSIQ